ncbi:MAG: hypothetical protein M3Y72_15170 [Acidobacteriota bacterium]|nr:hypothetical protein [Acidobacteriota bacterium]
MFVHGFDRPNIYLRVDRFENKEEKFEKLIQRVRWADKPGIVYVATQKTAEDVMRQLAEDNVKALFYHGRKAQERNEIQEQFMQGDAEVIVAINAFGMGIDKADVRFVYHYDVSDSLDSYTRKLGARDATAKRLKLSYSSGRGIRAYGSSTPVKAGSRRGT